MKAGIAYIDDNKLNLDCIKTILDQDFDVEIFQKPEAFLTKFESTSYTSILVDIHMPTLNGFSLYEKIIEHPHYNGCPILFISSDDSDSARIKSFVMGAVDFLNRAINPDEMIARIKSKIAFFQKHRSIIEFTNLRVNLTLLKAYLDSKELPLTFIEFKILCLVLRNYPDVVPKPQLIQQVWRTDHVLDATIYTHVSNLNSKLGPWDYEINGLKTKGVQLMKKA
ncbi:response regulator transcription factor [Peredibacter starrii]|uniref:Response regulator transcription factor n=1 Tax=Peredibacter starrii TaxID=28202 RepID=A0AAX4HRY8_9BACT|nr:response regulator transcription factor [Peredibacter starrii]WPU65945.1 response regulator transcription factor [Peredibacter starrii]